MFLLRRLGLDPALCTVFALSYALALFGLAQTIGTSGFMAVYVAAIVAGNCGAFRRANRSGSSSPAWPGSRKSSCFLMLGLLVTPSALLPLLPVAVPAVLLLLLVAPPGRRVRLPRPVPVSGRGRWCSSPGWGCAARCRSTSA